MTEYHLTTPISEKVARELKIGDIIYISGQDVYTARDMAHQRALIMHNQGKKLPIKLEGGVIYHSGPLVREREGRWEMISAGPTTSFRMEPYEDQFLRNFKVRILIGKGGMGSRTLAALKEVGAVYCSYIGGCGALAAQSLKEVRGYEWNDLGMPEALWFITADNFGPLIVTMDSYGNSLYSKVEEEVRKNKSKLYTKLGILEDS